MRIVVHNEKRIISIWLSKSESADAELNSRLLGFCDDFKKHEYTLAVFRSGSGNLEELTGSLLKYNRALMVEQEVKAEKKSLLPPSAAG